MSGLEVLLGLGIATNASWLIQNAKIVIFGKNGCKWCKKLKRYLGKLGNAYRFGEEDVVEVDIDAIKGGMDMFDEISEMTGNDTVPQVFVDETYIGGYPEFKRLYKTKQLHRMLNPLMETTPGRCIGCKKDDAAKKEKKKKQLEDMLQEADDDLLFANNAISLPMVAK